MANDRQDRKDIPDTPLKEAIRSGALEKSICDHRQELACYTAKVFSETGQILEVAGAIIGDDRIKKSSPFGHGSDEVVGVGILLRTGGQLAKASGDLLSSRQIYAGAALLRQLVEVEYLAWSFDHQDGDAQKWLRSDEEVRKKFFKPAILRKAAQGHFRGKDYGYHCEFGGHPMPHAARLLSGDEIIGQLFLSDMLGHTGRIWDHVVGWAKRQPTHGKLVWERAAAMSSRYAEWKRTDRFCDLPPP